MSRTGSVVSAGLDLLKLLVVVQTPRPILYLTIAVFLGGSANSVKTGLNLFR